MINPGMPWQDTGPVSMLSMVGIGEFTGLEVYAKNENMML
jgi:hypothetical protein